MLVALALADTSAQNRYRGPSPKVKKATLIKCYLRIMNEHDLTWAIEWKRTTVLVMTAVIHVALALFDSNPQGRSMHSCQPRYLWYRCTHRHLRTKSTLLRTHRCPSTGWNGLWR